MLGHPHVQAAARAGRGLGLADVEAEPTKVARPEAGADRPGVVDRLLGHPVLQAGAQMRGSVRPTLGLAESEEPEPTLGV